jgi:transcription initiation factor TFIIIB Brf1 subunit/transcription initiation factor TFIIB
MLLYKKVTGSKDIFRGSNKTALISACVYHVSKQRNLGISSAKISESFKVQNKNFSKFYKYLIESGVCSKSEASGNVLYKCSELVGRHCISLNMPYKAVSISKKIAESVEDLALFPNISLGALVAGVILFVSEEMKLCVKKKNITELCGTSESGMNKIFTVIKENKILILNNAKKN